MKQFLRRRSPAPLVEGLEKRVMLSAVAGHPEKPAVDPTPAVHASLDRRVAAQSTATSLHIARRVLKLGQPLRVSVQVRAVGQSVKPQGKVELIDNGQTLSLTLTLNKFGRATYLMQTGNEDLFTGGHALTALYTSSNSLFGSLSKTVFLGVFMPRLKMAADGLGTATIGAGHGKARVHAGQTATVLYTGFLQGNGEVFDYATSPNHGAGAPPNLTFVVEDSPEQVIPGFDRGVLGMKVGETRIVSIPAVLGYGASGSGDGSVPANADLLFLVKLQSIT
jgi:hypothetical protein